MSSDDEGAEEVVMVEHTDAPDLLDEDDQRKTLVEPAAAAAPTIITSSSNSTHVNEPKQPPEKQSQQTTTTSSVVKDSDKTEYAVNIVSIGTEADAYAFFFHKDRLVAILSKVPPGVPVATVSVVGAFRTGKSFLLSWFLLYLKHSAGGSHASEDDNKKWYDTISKLDRGDAFHWQAGSERDTTGIWMWSEPILHTKADGSKIAFLLIDTQGMFDHETSMNLTASIFGFSTLLSSYQIYNVDKRIQEDHLQQLALFSEYAKTAVEADLTEKPVDQKRPFQRMEFLVRDWQHYDDDEEEDNTVNLDRMEKQMKQYLEKVIAERDIQDLKETREQILGSFERITCFAFCHPGFAVTKKKFTGNVSEMEPLFLKLLDRYCQRVFSQAEPKEIHGRALTAFEFGNYCEAYAQLFADGAKFPNASTLLEATATTNNTNALQLALEEYHRAMDRIAGPQCSNYMSPAELEEEHAKISRRSLEVFKSAANFGSRMRIDQTREKLEKQVSEKYEFYHSLNEGRNPLLGFEVYLLPVLVAVASMVLRWVTDFTCSASVCRATSDALSHASAFVTSFLVIVAATKFQQLQAAFMRVKHALEVLFASQTGQQPTQKSKAD